MTKPAASTKTQAGNPGRVNQILRQTARGVAYLLASVALVAVVSSCQSSALNCNARPLPKECEHAL